MRKKPKPLLFTVMDAQLPDTLGKGAVATLKELANHYNPQERCARPSEQTLAAEIHVDERSVRRYLRQLAKEKFIKAGEGRPRHVKRWKINIPLINSLPKRHGPRAAKPDKLAGLETQPDLLRNRETGQSDRFKPDKLSADPPSDPPIGNYQDLDRSDHSGTCEIWRKNSASRKFPENDELLKDRAARDPAPDGNYRVIQRLAHGLLHRYGYAASHADLLSVTYDLKELCAQQKIRYDSAMIGKCLDSALETHQWGMPQEAL